MLQRAETETEFLKVGQLVLQKYNDLGAKTFASKVKPWVTADGAEKKHRFYEGATQHGSTNNGAESYHGKFKDSITERERVDFKHMVPLLRDELVSRSLEVERNLPEKPAVDLSAARKAFVMHVNSRADPNFLKYLKFKSGRYYLIQSSTADESVDLLKNFNDLKQANFNSLESYKALKGSFYMLRKCGTYYSCSCPVGQKSATQCKHAVFIAKKEGLHDFTEQEKDRTIRFTGNPPGRPRRAAGRGALSQK
ncbi:unnamed protein product [Bursaphelenchus xylophilus]|nr:unnamed protein product [Bursaphelenchus xylophilus]CAG9108657.1 unnamed protein product [Bursaphelenchus xylophilus]